MKPIELETGYYWVNTTTTSGPMIGFFYKDTHLPPWHFYADSNSYGWEGITEVICPALPPEEHSKSR